MAPYEYRQKHKRFLCGKCKKYILEYMETKGAKFTAGRKEIA
mgnify:CR=1 FL=1